MRCASVVIPTLNEAARIGAILDQLARLASLIVAEIIVCDGGSTDDTRAIVRARAASESRIRLIDNPARLQSAGVNRAVDVAAPQSNTIVRLDAHARYPDDYVPRVLAAMASSGADMVATRLRTVGETCLQRGIAAASNSRGGTGGSAHRVGGRSGFVDHGHHAGIDRAVFASVGGYDETFTANEDAEFDLRVRRAGGRIWLATDISADYLPRATWTALARQYLRYGEGRARTYLKHGERLRLRQLVPPALTATLAVAVALSPLHPWLLVLPGLYLAALLGLTAALWTRHPAACTLAAAPAMAIMHLAWGAGFIVMLLSGRSALPGAGVQGTQPFARGEDS